MWFPNEIEILLKLIVMTMVIYSPNNLDFLLVTFSENCAQDLVPQ